MILSIICDFVDSSTIPDNIDMCQGGQRMRSGRLKDPVPQAKLPVGALSEAVELAGLSEDDGVVAPARD